MKINKVEASEFILGILYYVPNSTGIILTGTICVGAGSQALPCVVTFKPKDGQELVYISLKINNRTVPLHMYNIHPLYHKND